MPMELEPFGRIALRSEGTNGADSSHVGDPTFVYRLTLPARQGKSQPGLVFNTAHIAPFLGGMQAFSVGLALVAQ